jgi:magnesium chelatase family protein
LNAGSQSQSETETARATVARARQRQIERQGMLNADLPPQRQDEIVQLNSDAEELLHSAIDAGLLSLRGYSKAQKLARTIADCADEEIELITSAHVAEALSFMQR